MIYLYLLKICDIRDFTILNGKKEGMKHQKLLLCGQPFHLSCPTFD